MKVPVRWLRELVAVEWSAEEVARRLTMAGLEAESITRIGDTWENVFVGHVERVEPHPNADRLRLVTVAAGEHRLTVVTGAPNIAEQQKVPLALVGARLYDGHAEQPKLTTLKASSIRGIRSEGMVCSEKELGLSDEHEGIMVLDPDAPIGTPLREYLGDEVIEFEITPNLVHAFSMVGIARELGALAGQHLRLPQLADLAQAPKQDGLVTIHDTDLCSRYVGVVIENIRVEPSPDWMQRRLLAAGVRPINNIVDVTNYVMLEWGQPLHAFDRDRLSEGRVVVRRAETGERIETLDHIDRELDTDVLLIADAERGVAIAGVMGGVDSEISGETTTILLESATFDMANVRRTARLQRLRTEASARFERGLDPNLAWQATERATALIQQLVPGARVTAYDDEYPVPRQPRQLTMPRSEIRRLLGVDFADDVVLDILDRLEFQPDLQLVDGEPTVSVQVPTWRNDITLKADLVEEVARIAGYENLPETLPVGQTSPLEFDPLRQLTEAVQDLMVAAGYQEIITYSMINEADLRALNPGASELPDRYGFAQRPALPLVAALNPLRSDWELMRPTLLASHLKNVAENLKFSPSVAVFETARVFLPLGQDELPDERRTLSFVLAGVDRARDIYGQPRPVDFFDAKGTLEAILPRLGATQVSVRPTAHPSLHPARAADMLVHGRAVGIVGEVHPIVAEQFGISAGVRVALAEIDLVALQATGLTPVDFRPVSRFQPVAQDFAVVVREEVPAADVAAAIAAGAGPLLGQLTLFDVYRGPAVGAGEKSLAYRVELTAPDRALSEQEIGRLRARIEAQLERRVKGTLRA